MNFVFSRLQRRLANSALLGALCGGLPLSIAHAWTIALQPASPRIFLQVGNGNLNSNNATVNRITVTVPANQIGTGIAQQMSSNSTQANSPLNGYAVCAPPAQVYVGGSYQRNGNGNGLAPAALQVTSPPTLTSGADTIPITEISWSTSTVGTADATPNVIPAGSFNGASQFLASVPANTYIENCHAFSYANAAVRAAGVYDGRVEYTLTAP